MILYIFRKLVGAVSTLLGVSIAVFILFDWVGGDPTYQMVGRHASEIQIKELRKEYGFDQPGSVRFLEHLKQVVTFDFGRSYATRQSISQMIFSGVFPSLFLTVPSFFITTLFSIGISLCVVRFRSTWFDRLIVMSCVFGMSFPFLAFILFGQYFLAYRWGFFPISGFEGFSLESVRYLAMPILIFVLVNLGYDIRYYRTALLEEVHEDYVRTARSKGLSEMSILFKHILRNSMGSILTHILSEVPILFLGVFLLENFFGIPGLGSMTIDAIHSSDFPVIKAMTTFVTILLLAGNLMTDLLYVVVDPRIRIQK